MIYRYLFITATGMMVSLNVLPQSEIPGTARLSETLIESVESLYGETADFESIMQNLEDLQKNPLDLNTATREQFEKLPFLTDFQINSLLDYRKEKGKLISIYELQLVYGFTPEVIDLLIPFVTIANPDGNRTFGTGRISKHITEEAIFRVQRVLERSKGYLYDETDNPHKNYPGSPWLLQGRYMVEADDQLFSGITVENDPGESFFKKSNKNGFDFVSAYLMVKNTGIIQSAVVGDYRMAFGQGLTLWNGAAPGKSSLPMNIVKRQDGIKTFTSNDENNFFRGAAASLSWKNFSGSLFFSSKKRDANITDTVNGKVWFSSFQESGYHRTSAEISDEKSVRETVLGVNAIFRNQILKVGTTLVSYNLDKYMEAGSELKDVNDFSGRSLINLGIDYAANLKKFRFFGETATGNSQWATLNGLLMNVNKYASFSVLYRKFGSGYYSMHSAAFSEGSADSNEEGFFMGTVLHPIPRVSVSAYADFYRFPWLKKDKSFPSAGNNYLLQTDVRAGKNVDMYLRLKMKKDPGNANADTIQTPEMEEIENAGLRFHISYKINSRMVMQNRLEYSYNKPEDGDISRGFLVYHDIGYRMTKLPLKCALRVTWFHTDDFSSRIYAYEQDMTAGFSFSPLYGSGLRSYIMVTANPSEHVSISVRFSNSWYSNRNSIGSGYDEISSDVRNDIKIRLALRF